MKGQICFYEPNEALAERLVDYWIGHGLGQCSICYYSDVCKWQQDAPGLFADLWILDSSLKKNITISLSGKVLWLTDRKEDESAVFKYCSAAVLLHMIEGYLSNASDKGRVLTGTHLISLYSPVKRCLQSTFGITLAHLLSKKGRVLYLNLEGYSGFDYLMAGTFSKDISDFIYYVHQSSEDIPFITQKFIYRLGEIDMIPPVLSPFNLQDITEDMWISTLKKLKDSGLYDYIITDVSDFIHGTFSILQESQYIFSLTRTDSRASAKWQQYCHILEEAGYLDILNKTHQSKVPHMTELPSNLEECVPGTLKEFVENAAKEAGLI